VSAENVRRPTLSVDIRELTADEVERVDAVLPLHRLDGEQTYLVAWHGQEPVGHAYVAWNGTRLGAPEVQDVFVAPDRRRLGVAAELMAAAERLAAQRGHTRITLGHGVANEPARRLYEGLGYRGAGVPPERVAATILIRGREVAVDDTVIYLSKDLRVDSERGRSS
jgi:GNAT superfamily N-acetyltransferase